MRARLLACLALLSLVAVGCGDTGNELFQGTVCEPDEVQPCECATGGQGTSTCLPDGTAMGECVCADASVADGAAGGSGQDAAADTSKGGSAGADAAIDAGDAAVGVLGDPCVQKGKLACAGYAQKLRLLCDGTKWVASGTCQGAQLCDPREGLTAGSCQDPAPGCAMKTPGVPFCDGAVRKVCGPDLLTASTAVCASEALCKGGTGAECAVCIVGHHQCDGANLMVCSPDQLEWSFKKACPSQALCDAYNGICAMPQCSPTQHRCVGDTLEKCFADLTGFAPVQICQPGLCDAPGRQCDVCVAGTKTCHDATQVRTCNADGQGQSVAPCPSATPHCSGQGQCGD